MSKTPNIQVELQISSFSAKGFGVGLASKKESSPAHKVEVPHTVPGDIVKVEINRKRKGAYFGYRPIVVHPSQDRSAPRCIHAEYCGGCSWQQVSYERQLKEKEKFIHALFDPLVKSRSDISAIIGCEDPWQYRNKMEYSFSENRSGEKFLGLIMTGGKGRVFNLTECYLTHPWFAKALDAVMRFWQRSGLKAFNMRSGEGSLRTLTLRRGVKTGSMLVMLTVSGDPLYAIKRELLDGFVQSVLSTVSEEEKPFVSIFLRVQQAIKGSATQFFEMHLFGPDHLKEELEIRETGKKYIFKISPSAFFQPNTLQAERLYGIALSFAGKQRLSHVLDLYAGTSTLGILFSAIAEKVTSIEINPHATFDAQVNKEENAAQNLDILKGDVADVLATLQEASALKADFVVVDPPRAGLDPKALSILIGLKAERLLYISCNPKTQAENVKSLIESGYVLEKVQPVDQFPHTVHIENICLLRRDVE